MKIEVNPRDVFTKLLYLVSILLFLNILTIISKYHFGHDVVYGLIPLFDFGQEKNIPTLYSSLALFTSSMLLSIIALCHKKNKSSYFYWLGLAVIFLFLSIDETASIHEKLIDPVRETLNTSGLLYFAWVIPYGIALIIFVLVYANFLIKLPNNIMILFIISGVTFISGAIGFELFGGRHYELYGNKNTVYSLFLTCEESLEMLGIVIFIYTLLTYIVNQFGSLSFTLNKSE